MKYEIEVRWLIEELVCLYLATKFNVALKLLSEPTRQFEYKVRDCEMCNVTKLNFLASKEYATTYIGGR